METAMTQFLEWLENSSNVKDDILNWELVKENALEKEKEQIIDAHKIGWEDCQEYIKTIGQTTRKGKKYYNQTYNQNK
jgi:hypothetical protein